MALTHFIAHHLQRPEPNTPSLINLRDDCWQQDGRIEECFRELKLAVIKRFSKDYGCFSDDYGKHPLSSWLKEYSEDKLGFASFTKKAMQHLKTELDSTDIVVDGFFFFAHEKLEHDELVHLFFVQHNTGQYIDNDIAINESFYLDTANVNLAAKINIGDWQSDDSHRSSNALTLLRWRGEKELSDIFSDFIGFANKVDLSAETEAFLETVADYTKELPETEALYTKKKIVDYCLEQDKIGKPVVMDELSTELKHNPLPVSQKTEDATDNSSDAPSEPALSKLPEFSTFIAETKPSAKPELIPDKTQLRQFVRLSGRDHKLSMSFSSSCLGDSILYDPTSESLTIHNLPPTLKARLVKHFQQKGAKEN